MPIIQLNNVTFSYPVKDDLRMRAIKNLSFDVQRGEFVALVGMNGSGKSTLAKLLNGLFVPDSGEVLIDGLSTADDKNIFEVRRRVGMVFQNPDNQTVATLVEDDVAFGPENLGLDREEIRRRVDFALSAVGMEEYRNHSASKLSGGQKQRIAIAGVLAMKPDVLILDEATAMLDPLGRREVMDVAMQLNKQGITVINITHNMDEAALASRIVVLRKGRLAADGAPAQLFGSDVLEACGLALPPVAKLAKQLESAGFQPFGTVLNERELLEDIWRQLK